MTPSTAPLLHHAAPGVVLTRATHEDAHPSGVRAMADALRALDGIVAPLCVQVDLDHVDALGLAAGTLAEAVHVLRAPVPDGVRLPDLAGIPTTEVEVVDGDALSDWLGRLIGDNGVSWVHLRSVAARAYGTADLPATLRNLEGQPFHTVLGDDERGRFVAGPVPGSSVDPPIAVDATHEGFRLELQLRVVWPLWSKPGSPGQRALAERIERLIEDGWSLEHASGAFAALG